jgi:hypothetical protein
MLFDYMKEKARNFFFKQSNRFRTNFIKRCFTFMLLVLLFFFIRTSNILVTQVVFFLIFIGMLWELNKVFPIPYHIYSISILIILMEFFFNISKNNPNIFLYISFFRFLLLAKDHKRFYIYLLLFLIFSGFFLSFTAFLVCVGMFVWDNFLKQSKKYLFIILVVIHMVLSYVQTYYK